MTTIRTTTALVLLCMGCGPEDLVHSPGGDIRTSGYRFTLPHISFNLWTDVLSLQAGLCADSCTFLDPIADDHSTTWPPLQVFWIIYDSPKDVLDGDEIFDSFWLGDEVHADAFDDRDGQKPLGFQFVPPMYQGMVPIQSTEVSDDGQTLTGELGGGVDAWIRVRATNTPDGCGIDTSWCTHPCDTDDWHPFSSLHIELSPLRTVQSWDFVP